MLKTCETNNYKIVIDTDGAGTGQIVESNLTNFDEEDEDALQFQGAMHGIEALILAMACAGCDIESEAFGEAVFTAVEAVANNID